MAWHVGYIDVEGLLTVGDELGGLYDGFEAYRTPTEYQYRQLLTDGLVVVDTNVLLNLYRYNEKTRADLLSVLRGLGERLWVPRQVMVEFWRNRETVLRDPRDTGKTVQELSEHRDKAFASFRSWANRVGLSPTRSTALTDALASAFATVIEGVTDLADDSAREFARNTNIDPVLQGLDEILQGRIGLPLAEADYSTALEEATRRNKEKIPPGYKDANKGGVDAAGDYLVWAQLILEARDRGKDVLLVTGDVKEDWWRRERGELRGPRLELVEEILGLAGVNLYLLRPDSLMIHARQALRVEVSDESVEDVERVDRSLVDAEAKAPPEKVWGRSKYDGLALILILIQSLSRVLAA